MNCSIKININKKLVYIKAIIDTGNFLKDPISKAPVIVVEKKALIGIVPNCILDNLDKIINGEDIDLGTYISKIRLIPFTSLGKSNGILIGIKAEEVFVELEENNININNVIIGIYNGNLSKNGKYRALIGLDTLEKENEYEMIKDTV